MLGREVVECPLKKEKLFFFNSQGAEEQRSSKRSEKSKQPPLPALRAKWKDGMRAQTHQWQQGEERWERNGCKRSSAGRVKCPDSGFRDNSYNRRRPRYPDAVEKDEDARSDKSEQYLQNQCIVSFKSTCQTQTTSYCSTFYQRMSKCSCYFQSFCLTQLRSKAPIW